MIHFFRRIRQALLNDNKYRKYLLYALGEIALVMIGILLALQINNWNEAKKDAVDEAYILQEILGNLQEDAQQLTYISQRRAKAQIAVQNLIQGLTATPDMPVNSEDFAAFVSFERYYPLRNAFEMMKSTGLKITNQKLGSAISRYFDYEQKNVNKSIEDIESVILRLFQTENALRSNLKRSAVGTKANSKVEFYDDSDPGFKQLLMEEIISFQDNNSTSLDKVNAFLVVNSNLIDEINSELQSPRLSKYLNQE